jgi:plasmid stabilization system protein ParE
MKYTVVWTATAEQDLAAVWLGAADRQAVDSAADTIDRLLSVNTESRGTPRFDTVRTLAVAPLAFDFEVVEADRIVWVLSAWDTTKGTVP